MLKPFFFWQAVVGSSLQSSSCPLTLCLFTFRWRWLVESAGVPGDSRHYESIASLEKMDEWDVGWLIAIQLQAWFLWDREKTREEKKQPCCRSCGGVSSRRLLFVYLFSSWLTLTESMWETERETRRDCSSSGGKAAGSVGETEGRQTDGWIGGRARWREG